MCSEQRRAVAGVALDHAELRRASAAPPCAGSSRAPAACRRRAAARRRRGCADAPRAARAPGRPATDSCATRRVCSRVEVSLTASRSSRRADPGAEQRLLLGDDVLDVDLRAQGARRRGAREIAHERRHDDDEGAQLEHVAGPEADRPDRAQQVRRHGDGEPHEPCRDRQVADAARELERAQRTQGQQAVDQRVDRRRSTTRAGSARRGRSGSPRGRAARPSRTPAPQRRRRSAGARGRARSRARAAARAARPGSRLRRAAPPARPRRRPRRCTPTSTRKPGVVRPCTASSEAITVKPAPMAAARRSLPAHADRAEDDGQRRRTRAPSPRRRRNARSARRRPRGRAPISSGTTGASPMATAACGRGEEACDGSCARYRHPRLAA